MAKKVYNADKNEFEEKKDTGPTPASNTRKKMKAAAKKAKAPKAKKAAKAKTPKAKAKEKPPVPKDRPKKAKEPVKGLTLPSASVAESNAKTKQLKGPVPKKNKVGITKGGNTGDKSKKGANQIATYLKRKKQLGN